MNLNIKHSCTYTHHYWQLRYLIIASYKYIFGRLGLAFVLKQKHKYVFLISNCLTWWNFLSMKSLVTWSMLGWERMLLTSQHFVWWHKPGQLGSLQPLVNWKLSGTSTSTWAWLYRGQRRTLVDYQDPRLVQDARINCRVEFLCVLNGIEMRVLFNFKFRNASYLTDKCSVIRRRPSVESSFSPFNTRPLRLWSPPPRLRSRLLCALRH